MCYEGMKCAAHLVLRVRLAYFVALSNVKTCSYFANYLALYW